MSNNAKLTLCPCLLIQQPRLFMQRQRAGQPASCLWLSNQATGPTAAPSHSRHYVVWVNPPWYSKPAALVAGPRITDDRDLLYTLPSRGKKNIYIYTTWWEKWSLHSLPLMKYTWVHCRESIHAVWMRRRHPRLNAKYPTGRSAWCEATCSRTWGQSRIKMREGGTTNRKSPVGMRRPGDWRSGSAGFLREEKQDTRSVVSPCTTLQRCVWAKKPHRKPWERLPTYLALTNKHTQVSFNMIFEAKVILGQLMPS